MDQNPPPDRETRRAAEPVERQLEEALAAIDTPDKAEQVVERLTVESAGRAAVEAGEAAPQAVEAPPAEQATIAAEAVEQAGQAAPEEPIERAVAVLQAAGAEAVALEGPAYEAVAGAVQQVTGPAAAERVLLTRPRRYLRDAIMRRMSFFQRYDTAIFLTINTLPHTPISNAFFHQLSYWFNGGSAWILGVALLLPVRPKAARALLHEMLAPIWVTSLVVEGPVKTYFRRRRPFIDIVRAIVVGKKPGNWSFPSGHTASAFAGAWIVSRHAPRGRVLWYPIAALVGFSRVYLGAHYPGDVLWGSAIGLTLAEGTRRIVASLTRFRR